MSRNLLIAAVALSLCIPLGSTRSSAAGKRPATKSDAAAAEVEAVLRDEAAGRVDRRERLASTLARHPDSALARWQAGFVREGKSWQPFEKPQSPAVDDDSLERYRERREAAAKTFADQKELAEWCRKQGLADQERAHLGAALLYAPTSEQSALYPRLGYCKVGERWVSGEQLAVWQEMNRRVAAAVKSWSRKLEKIAEQLSGSRRQYVQGLANLKELTNTESLPAVEYILCGRDETSALAALEALAGVKGYQGSLALARQAVFSKWTTVNERATTLLKQRSLDEFVHDLIGLLASPVTATYSAAQLIYFQDRPGDSSPCGFVLIWNYILARETDDQFQVAVLHAADYRLNYFMRGAILNSLDLIGMQTGYWQNSKGMVTGEPRDPLTFPADRYSIRSLLQDQKDVQEIVRSDAEQVWLRDQQVDAFNDRTEQLNRQTIAVLAGVTGREPDHDPARWWQWWADYSDVQQTGEKPIVTVVDETNYLGDPTLRFHRISGKCCCLAAGTPVRTDQGLAAIEDIKIGDRVLSQDIESGGLAYKPVLQTTIRPPAEVTAVRAGGETFVCTRAHRFWKSGHGWIRASELEPHSLLHTVTGNTPAALSTRSDPIATYNLVVADFHTYFIGKAGLLSQDLLRPRGTDNVVPGLAQAQAAQK
jgi:hypothetical protein